jgi:hypothetical protein
MVADKLRATAQTQGDGRTFTKIFSPLKLFVSAGLAVMLFFTAFSFINTTGTKPNRAAPGDALAFLSGEPAITHLKQTGSFPSLAAAVKAARYEVEAGETGATAHNAANNLLLDFTAGGLRLESAGEGEGWSSSWRLRSFGYGSEQTAAAQGALRSDGNRVEVKRDEQNLTEWYVNTPGGLEHGFILASRPRAEKSGEALRLVLAVEGDLKARADEDGRALTLHASDGAAALRYEKLRVWDADGTELAARMRAEVGGGEVWLEVEDAAAAYPLTIDPTFVQQQKLTASDGTANDFFWKRRGDFG